MIGIQEDTDGQLPRIQGSVWWQFGLIRRQREHSILVGVLSAGETGHMQLIFQIFAYW